MKKLILPAACFAVLSTPAFEKIVHAAENGTTVNEVGQIHTVTKYVKVDPGSNLNLRASSSSSGTILTKLANDSKVMVYSESNGWAKIKANGKEGYVSAEYLTTITPSKSSASSTPVPVPEPTTTTKYVKVVAGSNLNLRSSASTKGYVLEKLVNGTEVIVYSESNGWAKIKANGKEGYVSAEYLTTITPSKSSMSSAPTPVSAPVPKPTTTTKYVKVVALFII